MTTAGSPPNAPVTDFDWRTSLSASAGASLCSTTVACGRAENRTYPSDSTAIRQPSPSPFTSSPQAGSRISRRGPIIFGFTAGPPAASRTRCAPVFRISSPRVKSAAITSDDRPLQLNA
jgi:hypothetical protein